MERDTRAGSVPYLEAGERMRLSQARLVEAKAGLPAWRVAAAVWGLTAGYSKGWDAVFVDGLAELTGMDGRAVRRGIKECEAAGALQWLPSNRGKRGRPSLVGLPLPGSNRPGQSPARVESARAVSTPLPSYEVMSNEGADSRCGEQPQGSPRIAHRGSRQVEGSEPWEAEGHARPQARPGPEAASWAAVVEAAVAEAEAELGTPSAADRFAPWHGDERTGDTTGESEAELMRWAGANPAKARARRIRGD